LRSSSISYAKGFESQDSLVEMLYIHKYIHNKKIALCSGIDHAESTQRKPIHMIESFIPLPMVVVSEKVPLLQEGKIYVPLS